MADTTEFREGHEAQQRGKPADDNPYPWNNKEWWRNDEWQKGWEEAQRNDNSEG